MRDPYDPHQDELAAATPVPAIGPTATELKQRAIRDCDRCDTDGYRGTQVCDHRPDDPAETAARHMAALRAQMGWNEPSGTTTPDGP